MVGPGIARLQAAVGNRAIARLVTGRDFGATRSPRVLARDLLATLDSLGRHPRQIWQGVQAGMPAAVALHNAGKAWDRAAVVVAFGVNRGPQNAVRHCLWSALTFRDLSVELREYDAVVESTNPSDLPTGFPRSRWEMLNFIQQDAEDAVMVHERAGGGQLDPADSALDQFNNRVGFRIVRQLKGRARYAHDISDDRIVEMIRAYLEEGQLRMSDPASGMPVPTSGWRQLVVGGDDPWRHRLPQPLHPTPR
jgi:hypothetical protein